MHHKCTQSMDRGGIFSVLVESSTRQPWRWTRRSDPSSWSRRHIPWPIELNPGPGLDTSLTLASMAHKRAKELRTDSPSANCFEPGFLVVTLRPLPERHPLQANRTGIDRDRPLRLPHSSNLSSTRTNLSTSDRVQPHWASHRPPVQRLLQSIFRYVRIPF